MDRWSKFVLWHLIGGSKTIVYYVWFLGSDVGNLLLPRTSPIVSGGLVDKGELIPLQRYNPGFPGGRTTLIAAMNTILYDR